MAAAPLSTAGLLERLRDMGGLTSCGEDAGEGSTTAAHPRERFAHLAPLTTAAALKAAWKPAAAPPFATGVAALDELLGGGLPRGQMVELVGTRSSGRFSAVMTTLATVTAAGEAAALIDLGDGFDPQIAATLGMDLPRLLWMRPLGLKQALACTEIVLAGGFPLVVLDLGTPPVRSGPGFRSSAGSRSRPANSVGAELQAAPPSPHQSEAAWLRVARAAAAQRAALLVSSPYRISGTAAAAVLQAARGRAQWQGQGRGGWGGHSTTWLLDGLTCRLSLEKARGGRLPNQRTRLWDLQHEDRAALDHEPEPLLGSEPLLEETAPRNQPAPPSRTEPAPLSDPADQRVPLPRRRARRA